MIISYRATMTFKTKTLGGSIPTEFALKIGVGRDYNITLNFRCKLLIRSSYSHSALFAYPFGHHSRNRYLIPLAEGLFESPTEVPRQELQRDTRKQVQKPTEPKTIIMIID